MNVCSHRCTKAWPAEPFVLGPVPIYIAACAPRQQRGSELHMSLAAECFHILPGGVTTSGNYHYILSGGVTTSGDYHHMLFDGITASGDARAVLLAHHNRPCSALQTGRVCRSVTPALLVCLLLVGVL